MRGFYDGQNVITEYERGDLVRVKDGIVSGQCSGCYHVTQDMADCAGKIVKIASREDEYYSVEGVMGTWWTKELFEPVPQFSIGGIVTVNKPGLSDIIERKATSKEYPRLEKIDSETIKIIDYLNKERRYRWDGCKWNENGTKKSTGIESRKDIRKRLLKL